MYISTIDIGWWFPHDEYRMGWSRQTLGIQWSPSGTMEGSFASMWTPSMAHCLFCTDQQCHSGDHHQSFDVTTCWPKKRVLPEGPEGPDGYGLHLFLKMKAWGPASSSGHILVSFWIWNLKSFRCIWYTTEKNKLPLLWRKTNKLPLLWQSCPSLTQFPVATET